MTLRTNDPSSFAAEAVIDSLAGLPYYLANLSVALLLLTIATAAYSLLGGRSDLVRARQGHAASITSVSGVLLGFALPLASVIAIAGSLLDLLIWAAATLVVQLAAVLLLRRVLLVTPTLADGGPASGGALHGALALAIGLINAAAIAI